jgi:V/A-type H+-transporting ATPase subunit F
LAEKHIAVIADPYVASMFRLLGLYSFSVSSEAEARAVLNELVSREDIGMIFVAAEIYQQLSEEFLASIRRQRPDLIISGLPTIYERGKPMDVQKELLKALGMG